MRILGLTVGLERSENRVSCKNPARASTKRQAAVLCDDRLIEALVASLHRKTFLDLDLVFDSDHDFSIARKDDVSGTTRSWKTSRLAGEPYIR